jgi:STE24 endopeptidase
VMLHARQYFGLLLAPVLLLLAMQDVVLSIMPQIDGHDNEVVVYLAALVVLLIFFPMLVRCVWRTTPLPNCPLRERLVAVYRGHRAPVREILIWQTGDRILNAAVAGFFGRWRYMFLTDALLRHLVDDEVAAVFAHEVGHIRHRHVWLRLLAGAAPIVLLLSLDVLFPTASAWLSSHLATVGLPQTIGLWMVALAALAVYAVTLFGPYCRLLEYQADLFACVHGGPPASNPAAAATMANEALLDGTRSFCAALERIAALSGGPRRKATWLHPSTARRVEFVTRTAGDALRSGRFRRRVWRINGLLIGAVVTAVLLVLFAR